jgi:hypothetical protein
MKRLISLSPCLLVLILLLAACGEDNATPTPTIAPTPTPDPVAILQQAGEAMQGLQSVHFNIARTGGSAYLDADQLLILNTAVGDYAAPDAAQATINIASPGVALIINTIAIGEEQWITNPLNQQWELLPAGWGFNPAVLFDPELGWRPLLNEDMTDITLLGLVDLSGQNVYHLQGTASGERIQAVTGGLTGGDEPITIEAWVDPTTHHVLQLHFVTGTSSSEPVDWLVNFSNFNTPVTIEPPL